MSSQNDYSLLDRLIHEFAFAAPWLQIVLGDLENDLFRKRIEAARTGGEVFVTGLPRAGTTLVLGLLHATGEFATFTYRQMPFILAPLLWDRISHSFRKKAVSRERAHGDGMSVSFDSPEAFEEVIWLAHKRKDYVRPDRLLPLAEKHYSREFAAVFRKAVAKCALLDGGETAAGDEVRARYLSKNNANISRLGLLRKICPDGRFLIPFRHPLAHASSLMKQHRQFLDRHDEDAFSRKYMRWLGHFEFGGNFRPIDFDGRMEGPIEPAAVDPEFWVRYWTTAYAHLLERRDPTMMFVDFEGLLADGRKVLGRIADHVGLADPDALIAGAATLRSPTTKPYDHGVCSTEALDAAMAVHEKLRAAAS